MSRSSSDLTYFGGPWDGQRVVLEAGWPPPDVIGHVNWPQAGYVRVGDRYEWREPRRARP